MGAEHDVLADRRRRVARGGEHSPRIERAPAQLWGHIGYGIKPSARGRGLATKQLELALEKAKELGIERALITCDRTNVASRQVILNNGGVADTPFMEESGKVVERFWIELKG